jgi:hypothetical protein
MKLTVNDLRKLVRDQIQESAHDGSAKDRLNAKVDYMRIPNTSKAAAKALQVLTGVKEKLSGLNADFSDLGVSIDAITSVNTSLDVAIEKMSDVVAHPGHYVKSAQEMSKESETNKIKLPVGADSKKPEVKDSLQSLGEKLARKLR